MHPRSPPAGDEIKDIKRYDRQIRLWGLDTQRGLQGARVLILGVDGLSNEIAKNLVLAGVGTVHIQDPGSLSADDIAGGGLFSVTTDQLGMSRAKALTEQLTSMNPQVSLEAHHVELATFDASFLASFHFIIGTRGADAVHEVGLCTAIIEGRGKVDDGSIEQPPAKRHRANGDGGPPLALLNGAHVVVPMRALASEGAAPTPRFIAAGCIGLDGFCFLDLGAPVVSVPPIKKPAEGEPPLPHVEERALYPTVSAASEVEWAALGPRVPPLYFALQLLPSAVRSGGATEASPADADAYASEAATLLPDAPVASVKRLQTMLARRAAKLPQGGPPALANRVTSQYLARVAQAVGTELAPVCAIVGGMVASEVVKIISGKERPINNVLFFDGASSDGIVQRLGPSFDCSWGLDRGDFKPVKR